MNFERWAFLVWFGAIGIPFALMLSYDVWQEFSGPNRKDLISWLNFFVTLTALAIAVAAYSRTL